MPGRCSCSQSTRACPRAGLCGERGEDVRWMAEDREVPVARVDLKPRARYRLCVEARVQGRNGYVGITLVHPGRCLDGAEVEAPGPGEHPQVLGDAPAATAERLDVAGEERLAHAGLLEGADVGIGLRGCRK